MPLDGVLVGRWDPAEEQGFGVIIIVHHITSSSLSSFSFFLCFLYFYAQQGQLTTALFETNLIFGVSA